MTAPTDDQGYQDKLSNMESLSDGELSGLETAIVAAFEAADAADDLDAMNTAANDLETVKAEASRRGLSPTDPDADGDDDTSETDNPDAAEDLAAAAAVADPETAEAPEVVDPEPAEAVAATETETPDVADALEAEAPTDDPETAEATAEAVNEEEASVDTPSVPEDRQPLATPVAASNVVVAGADVPHVSAGMEFKDRAQFTQAMSDKVAALRGARGDGEKVLVASVKTPDVDDSRILLPGDVEGNADKIAEVIGRDVNHVKALVASGGYCAPLESRYDVFGIGVTDRPVRDALPGFRAARGGIRFITPPKLSGVTGSAGVWTAATDASPGGSTKNKLIVTCGAEQTVSISAITMQLQFGNFITRAYPEMVARNVELGLIAQARLAEQTLLTAIGTLSTAVTTTGAMGTARDFLYQVARAASSYRTRHRMAADAPLRVIAPAWLRDAIRDDVANSKAPTTDDVLGESDAQINAWLTARNVNVSWQIDDASYTGAQAAGTLAVYPATAVWYIFAEGTFLFLDGGTLDIGIVRDSTLVGTNDYIQFTENFEAVAMVGVESLKVTSTMSVKGLTGGDGTVTTP